MHPKRTAYILLALALGFRTPAAIHRRTGLPVVLIIRALRDHSKRLGAVLTVEDADAPELKRYSLTSWGMLDGKWVHENGPALAESLGLPELH